MPSRPRKPHEPTDAEIFDDLPGADKAFCREALWEAISRFRIASRKKPPCAADLTALTGLVRTYAQITCGMAPTRTELSGPGGAPITLEAVSKLNEAQLDALIATNDVNVLRAFATVAVPDGNDRKAEAGTD